MVISAQEPDLGTVATLAAQLWPDNTPSELVSEFQQLLSQDASSATIMLRAHPPVLWAI